MKACVFVEDPKDPAYRVCLGKSGKVGSNPDDGCGGRVRSKLPGHKLRGDCDASAAAIRAEQPEMITILMPRHVGFGDALDFVMRVACFGASGARRKAAWVKFRNFFAKRFFREVLGIYVRPSQECSCDARKHFLNAAGKFVVPKWLWGVFPPRLERVAKQRTQTEFRGMTNVNQEPKCESCSEK